MALGLSSAEGVSRKTRANNALRSGTRRCGRRHAGTCIPIGNGLNLMWLILRQCAYRLSRALTELHLEFSRRLQVLCVSAGATGGSLTSDEMADPIDIRQGEL